MVIHTVNTMRGLIFTFYTTFDNIAKILKNIFIPKFFAKKVKN